MIPARYASTRFPGKPLAPLLGKPMVLWVAELSARAVGNQHVYIATDDDQIADVATNAGFHALLTQSNALTGTDRIAEAAQAVDYDIYVNVQGDEPLVQPQDIIRCIELKKSKPDSVINGFCWIGADEDPASLNIPKVVAAENGHLMYISRALLPGFKDAKNAPPRYMKQVCIYAFDLCQLNAYAGHGRKSALENYEDIEILRFLELGQDVFMFECSPGSLSVDVPADIPKVEAALLAQRIK